jgi:DNA-binding NarL/FixJ family response regulator
VPGCLPKRAACAQPPSISSASKPNSSDRSEDDVLRSYSLHANAYVTKPADFERFMDAIREINNFFVTVVQLPDP